MGPIVGDVWIRLPRQVPQLDQDWLDELALLLALPELALVLFHESAELFLLCSLLKLELFAVEWTRWRFWFFPLWCWHGYRIFWLGVNAVSSRAGVNLAQLLRQLGYRGLLILLIHVPVLELGSLVCLAAAIVVVLV